jgi:PD-(D/E)XK nuclease superfamily
MPIKLITGPANAGKAELVMDAVRRHLAHGQEPLLVVPTRADADHYLRELAGEGASLGVRVERFSGLLGEAVRRTGVGSPVLAGIARERVLAALAERAGIPATRGSVRALAELVSELQVQRVTPAALDRALAGWAEEDGPGVSRGELGALFADYRATLERLGRMDGEQRAVAALDALRRRPALWGATPVLVYGFDDLTRLQLDAIETLGRVVGAEVTVSLAYEPGRAAFAGRAASFHALEPLALEHRRLQPRAEYYAPSSRTALSHLERSLFEPLQADAEPVPAGAERVPAGAAVRLLEGGGERAELELVAAEIGGLLSEGLAPEEIAVLVRTPGISLELLAEVFAAAAIPFSLRRRRPFGDTAIGGALLGLLRSVPAVAGTDADGGEQQAGELGDLLAWLRAPGLLEQPALADSLEVSARRSGAVSAQRARAMWEQRHWPLETIERLLEAQARGAMALVERAQRELYWLFCAPRRAGACILAADELDEAAALAAGRRALGELRELARMASELAPASAWELARVLAAVELSSGETSAPGTVAVLDPLALRARRVRALFVCGLQEGVFPARARPQPFLAEEERRRLAEVSGLRLGEPADALAAERYLLYAAVSRPREQLFLSWHVADDDGQAMSRSLFVDDVCDLFADSLSRLRARRPLGAVDGMPAQRALGAAAAVDRTLHDERLLAALRDRPWSASSLEKWIGCPTRWFVERMLSPGAFEPDPEPLARGGLAHAALRDTLSGLRAETGSARLTAANLARARELLTLALAANEADHPLSVAPERSTAVRRRLHADLERYLAHAAAANSPLEPTALELGFGFAPGDHGSALTGHGSALTGHGSALTGHGSALAGQGQEGDLPALDLGGGMRLRGRIDRVDVSDSGDAVVYDYKGSSAPAGARWLKDGSLQVALYMRAVEDLLGLRVVGGFYQPLSGEDLRARGVLDGDAGLQLDSVTPDVYEHSEVRALLEAAVAAAREAAAEAARGELAARPQSCAFRGGCMYPTICRCDQGGR